MGQSRSIYRTLNNLLDSFDPEEAAKNSFDNYHAVGLTYLNLLRTPRLTIKIYLSESGVKHNPEGFLVWPHAHRYNFETTVLLGQVDHYTFIEKDGETGFDDDDGIAWNRFKFHSVVNGGSGFKFDKPVLLIRGHDRFQAGDSYYLDTTQIHTIQVHDRFPTVQFQVQYHDVPKPETFFYSPDPAPPSVEGLYVRMTPQRADDVRKRIEDLLT